jgi:hypothetical protein
MTLGISRMQQGHVLRVRKKSVDQSDKSHAAEHGLADLYDYTTRVIAPLLGAQHMEPGVCLVLFNPTAIFCSIAQTSAIRENKSGMASIMFARAVLQCILYE